MPAKNSEILERRREMVLSVVSNATPNSRTRVIERLADSLYLSPKTIYKDLEAKDYDFPSNGMGNSY